MKNKIKLFVIVLLVVAIVGLAIVLGLVFKDVNQRNELVSQINAVIEQKMSNDNIVLTGEYGKIEKQVKEDYKTYFEAIDTIQTNNNDEISIAATPKDSIYCLKILDAIKDSANKGISVSFEEETNSYF